MLQCWCVISGFAEFLKGRWPSVSLRFEPDHPALAPTARATGEALRADHFPSLCVDHLSVGRLAHHGLPAVSQAIFGGTSESGFLALDALSSFA